MTDSQQDPLALESQVCFALSLASRSVIAAYKPVLEPLGLTHPQYLMMLALWEYAPLSLRELSEYLYQEPATTSPIAKRLEAAGLLRRERDADDERSLSIVLTERGAALRKEAQKIPAIMMDRLGMDAQELQSLHGSMMKLINVAVADGRL